MKKSVRGTFDRLCLRAIFVLALLAGGWSEAAVQPGYDTSDLTMELLLRIRHPSSPKWSPDGKRVAFLWDEAGVQNLWVVDPDQGVPKVLTQYDRGLIDGLFWSRDGSIVFYERDGDLWQVPIAGGPPQAVWGTPEGEGGVVASPDGSRVAFSRNGDIWVRSLIDRREIRLTEEPTDEGGPAWSPDGARIAFTVNSAKPVEDLYDYVGQKIAFRRYEWTHPDVGVVPADGGRAVRVAASPAAEGSPRWVDAGRLCLQRVSTDYKTREVLVVDVRTGDVVTLHRDADEKWWSLTFLGPEPKPSPDGRWVALVSDRDGWDHLYVVPSSGGTLHQVTKGKHEVRRFAWSPDGSRIAFDTNEGEHPGRRHLAVAEIGEDPATARIVKLTDGRGTNTQPADSYGFLLVGDSGGWSPDGSRMVYQHTDPATSADLFWVGAKGGGAPHRLTDSMPGVIERTRFVEPQLVWYSASDGQKVPAYLFVPQGVDRSRKHPAIVWVHGDGIAQNVDGWHIRRDYGVYYSFHQYLVQQGYVVLAPDYRGSIGYGRRWRQEVYMDVGGKDYRDVASGVDFLETLGFVDLERVGVWGLSYGGFFTLQALTLDPTLFRCGVDVAGVQDYRYWFKDPGGPWVVGRMGAPEENPEVYLQSAPIERIDRMERPLLVLHGTADVNVPFLESVRLVDVLLKKGKDFEFAMYPGELHYFHRGHVLRDAWTRVERFFSKHLDNPMKETPGYLGDS